MKKRHHSALIIDALNGFSELEYQIANLMICLQEQGAKTFLPEQNVFNLAPLPPRNDLERLNIALTDLWYRFDEDAVTTRKYMGVIICKQEAFDIGLKVNEAKDKFATAVRAIQEHSNREVTRFKNAMSKLCSAREELAHMRMGRINLNQCYRHIHMFLDMPKKIQYSTSTKEKSIKRVSIAEAEKMLLSFHSGYQPPHIKIQLSKLAGLKPGTPLAIVRELSKQIKVNLFYPTMILDKEHLAPITRKPGLPIFILDNGKTPDIRFKCKYNRSSETKSRNDILLEKQCFLPSISAYKYT